MGGALRVLTWNAWLQSDPSSQPDPHPGKRAPLIAEKLCSCNCDVLLLQKVWSDRTVLIDGIRSKFPHISDKINDKKGFNLHAGLLTASRFRLRGLGSIDFKETLGIEGAFSNKGAALWEGTWEGHEFQIASVHLQGHVTGDKKSTKLPATRRSQLRQLCTELLERHCREKVPQIICGDFSINHGTEDYVDALEILGADDGPITGKIPQTAYGREKGAYPNDIGRDFIDEPETLDYILLRHNGSQVTITRTVRRFREAWKARSGKTYKDLAYRYALEGEIEFATGVAEIKEGAGDELANLTALHIVAAYVL